MRILDNRSGSTSSNTMARWPLDVALNKETDGRLSVLPPDRRRQCASDAGLPLGGDLDQAVRRNLGGATVIGLLIVGLERPVQIVGRSAPRILDIVNMAALASFNIGG